MEKIIEWLNDRASGSGSGYGHGFGSGSGHGFGSGDGSGYRSGHGYDDGSGSGHGYRSGHGSNIREFNHQTVHYIDSIPTIITSIKESYAKGFILASDFELTSCYIAKRDGYYAHGKTLREATEALNCKIFANMDVEETIEKFREKFNKDCRYSGHEFFEWHNYLTGSCLMGRETFVKNHGLDLDSLYSVKEFIELCKNDYGGEIIRKLGEYYE